MIRGAVEISFDDQVICTLNPENMGHKCTPRRAGIEVPVGRAPIDGHSTHPSLPWNHPGHVYPRPCAQDASLVPRDLRALRRELLKAWDGTIVS